MGDARCCARAAPLCGRGSNASSKRTASLLCRPESASDDCASSGLTVPQAAVSPQCGSTIFVSTAAPLPDRPVRSPLHGLREAQINRQRIQPPVRRGLSLPINYLVNRTVEDGLESILPEEGSKIFFRQHRSEADINSARILEQSRQSRPESPSARTPRRVMALEASRRARRRTTSRCRGRIG